MWFSRLSFGVSIAALISTLVGGGCQKAEPDVGPEQVDPASRVSAVSELEKKADETALPVVTAPGAEREAVGEHAEKSEPREPDDRVARSEDEAGPTQPLELRRLVVTQAIEDREPVSVSSVELDDRPVIAFLDLKNPDPVAQTVVVTFERDGGDAKVGFVELEIPGNSKRWRTWGNTRRITEPGTWVAVVSTKAGQELGRQAFEVSVPKVPPVSERPGENGPSSDDDPELSEREDSAPRG